MHVMFVHPNYPAQFGIMAQTLAAERGFRCTFVSRMPPGTHGGVERVQYTLKGGSTQFTHQFCQPLEEAVWRTHAVIDAIKPRTDLRPDVVVGHSGYVNVALLRETFPARPLIGYFDFYHNPAGPDFGYRTDLPHPTDHRMPTLLRNSQFLLDLEHCHAGYTPTTYQWGLMPKAYKSKVRVIFDGIDTSLWRPRTGNPRQVNGTPIPDGMRVISYASPGLESVRGFDLFMKAAAIVCRRRTDVLFVVVGRDRPQYSSDATFTGGKTFRQWVLDQGEYDPSRFWFPGALPAEQLAELFSFTDLHVYLTVPFVLSWSVLNALACGAPILGSDTAPVREVIKHGSTGLLTDLFNTEAMADRMGEVLDRPADFRHLGQAGRQLVEREYSLTACAPRLVRLFKEAVQAG